MSNPIYPKCVVMGSFKFKPEIDLAIKELKNSHILVLGPDEGDLFGSDTKDFWPLASERKMSRDLVEQLFIRKILQSDFVYIVNPDGYVGDTVCLEIGVCIASGIPIYSLNEVDKKLDPDPYFADAIEQYIRVESLSNVIETETESKFAQKEGRLLKPSLKETLQFNRYFERK